MGGIGTGTVDWAFSIAGIALAVAGSLLLLWALLWDRSRGRRRCPRCWYDLAGVPGLTCPECGRIAQNERSFRRTRRRWRWAVCAVLFVLAGYAARLTPTVIQSGWRAAVPSTVLVYIAPVDDSAWQWQTFYRRRFGTPTAPLLEELMSRLSDRKLSRWQRGVVLSRFFRANPEQLRYMVPVRDKWPAGYPVKVRLSSHWILERMVRDLVVRARLHGEGGRWAQMKAGLWGGALTPEEMLSDLGAAPAASKTAEFDIEILDGATTSGEGPWVLSVDASTARRLWSGRGCPIRIVASPAETMTPYVSAGADGAVAQRASLVRDELGQIRFSFRKDPYHIGGDIDDWALGMSVSVRRDGVEVAQGQALFDMIPPGLRVHFLKHDPDTFPLDWLVRPPADQAEYAASEWEIVLTGDPAVAMVDHDRSLYWAGRVTVKGPKHLNTVVTPRWRR